MTCNKLLHDECHRNDASGSTGSCRTGLMRLQFVSAFLIVLRSNIQSTVRSTAGLAPLLWLLVSLQHHPLLARHSIFGAVYGTGSARASFCRLCRLNINRKTSHQITIKTAETSIGVYQSWFKVKPHLFSSSFLLPILPCSPVPLEELVNPEGVLRLGIALLFHP